MILAFVHSVVGANKHGAHTVVRVGVKFGHTRRDDDARIDGVFIATHIELRQEGGAVVVIFAFQQDDEFVAAVAIDETMLELIADERARVAEQFFDFEKTSLLTINSKAMASIGTIEYNYFSQYLFVVSKIL